MKSLVIGCIVALGVALLAGVAGIWYLATHEGPQLESQVQAPDRLVAGREGELVVRMSNPHDAPVVLDSIDVDDSLLEGFQVLSVDPKAADTMQVPILNQRTWSFDTPVAAGAEMEVRFAIRAIGVGHYTGNVGVCNPEQDCAGHFVDLVVEAAPAD